jgi:hypothetical protein
MTKPLKGSELLDCARANADYGVETTASRCGYDETDQFWQALHQAADSIGIEVNQLSDLKPEQKPENIGKEIAPDTTTEL